LKTPNHIPIGSLAVFALLAWARSASATDDAAKAAARELSSDAKADYDAGRFDDAGRKFRQAYDLAKVPTLAVWTARSLVSRGQLVAASEMYRQAAQLPPNDLWLGNTQQEAQGDAARELNALLPRIPKVRVHIEGARAAEVEVTINGVKLVEAMVDVDRLTDPGHLTVVGKRGAQVIEKSIDLGEGQRLNALLDFKSLMAQGQQPPTQQGPIQSTPSAATDAQNTGASSQRLWGWVSTGVGAAGLLRRGGGGPAAGPRAGPPWCGPGR